MKKIGLGFIFALVATSAVTVADVSAPVATDAPVATSTECPVIFQQQMKQLHSSKVLNLCDVVQGRPVLLVNTASHCGFTKQFGELEKIHQQYKERGLVVIGVSSDSFNQEADDEAKAADICFKNFGVTFTMLATVPVKGENAHPLFKEVARQDVAPKWNFYKYLVNSKGEIISSNSSMTMPSKRDIERLLARD